MPDRVRALARLLPALLPAVLFGLAACGGDSPAPSVPRPTPLTVTVPGFPPLPEDPDNPLTVEGVDLGRRLFFDPVLSADSTLSCAGCHDPAFGFTDRGRRLSVGVEGVAGTKNSMAILNLGWQEENPLGGFAPGPFFWDGRAEGLDAQALDPVADPVEMNLPWDDAVARLQRHPDYPARFAAAFGTDRITPELVTRAMAQFEKTLVSGNSRYDRWKRGQVDLTDAELRGRTLFFTEQGDCFHCHGEPFFTDHRFHNNGLDAVPEPGREAVTGNPADRGKFKTPTLRNLAFTAPYMHDGRFATLQEVIKHYRDGFHASPTVDPLVLNPKQLDPRDVLDLEAFLLALTDSSFVTNPDFGNPFGN